MKTCVSMLMLVVTMAVAGCDPAETVACSSVTGEKIAVKKDPSQTDLWNKVAASCAVDQKPGVDRLAPCAFLKSSDAKGLMVDVLAVYSTGGFLVNDSTSGSDQTQRYMSEEVLVERLGTDTPVITTEETVGYC